MNNSSPQETYYSLSMYLTALGAGFGIRGAFNVMEGISTNDPSVREQGEQQLRTGRNLVVLATYIEKGIMPGPEIMEHLATH